MPADRARPPASSRTQNIRSSLLADIDAYLRCCGQDPERIFAPLGFEPSAMQNPELRIPVHSLMDLLNRCAAITGQEDFGLRIADWRGMPDLGPIVFLLRNESTLRGALRTLVQALHLHSNAMYLSFDEGEDAAVLAMDVMTGEEGFSHHSAEMVVSALLHMITWLVGPGWLPLAVCLRHARRLPERTYRRYLRCTPDFRQEFNCVVIHKADLDLPLDHSTATIERQVSAIITTMTDEVDVYVYRVQQLLVLTLPRGEARATVVADLLQVDRRTLNRRLAQAGLNFSALLGRVRRELATQYVRNSDKPFSEVALLLGFESLSAFSRWFHGAFGQAPRTLRAARAG